MGELYTKVCLSPGKRVESDYFGDSIRDRFLPVAPGEMLQKCHAMALRSLASQAAWLSHSIVRTQKVKQCLDRYSLHLWRGLRTWLKESDFLFLFINLRSEKEFGRMLKPKEKRKMDCAGCLCMWWGRQRHLPHCVRNILRAKLSKAMPLINCYMAVDTRYTEQVST